VNNCIRTLLLSVLVQFSTPLPTWAVDSLDHGEAEHHQAVVTLDSLSFDQVLDQAIARAPEALLNQIYHTNAANERWLSKRWIAGKPRLQASLWDDRSLSDTGVKESELSVAMDLWRWGERDNARQLATAKNATAEAWPHLVRWQLVGELRQQIHDLDLTRIKREFIEQNIEDANRLFDISQKRFAAGDLPQQAVAQSELQVLQAKQALVNADTDYVDAMRSYSQLTGLLQRPPTPIAQATNKQEIDLQHPLLRFLQAKLVEDNNRLQRAINNGNGNTSLSLGVRRQRGNFEEDPVDAMGIAISIPFGSGKYGQAHNSEAALAATQAQVNLMSAQRALQKDLHEVQHALEVLNEKLTLAARSEQLNRDYAAKTLRAFELGEADITAAVLAQQSYQQSKLQFSSLQLEQQFLIFSFNHVVGEMP